MQFIAFEAHRRPRSVLGVAVAALGVLLSAVPGAGREVPFAAPRAFSPRFAGAISMFPADLDGDGDLDVVGGGYDAAEVLWWENAGRDGTQWTSHTVRQGVMGARSVAAADFDGDGDQDVAAAAFDANTVAWWENTLADGTLWTTHTLSENFAQATALDIGDLDGDGAPDILAAAKAGDEIAWWRNSGGDAEWTRHSVAQSFDGAASVCAADVDGDGSLDVLAAARDDDEVAWWRNVAGNGLAWTKHVIGIEFDGPESVRAADVDRDGDLDAVAAGYYADEIVWWENVDGTGLLWVRRTVGADFDGAWFVETADLDADGDVDILGAAWAGDRVAWWENADGRGALWHEYTIAADLDRAAAPSAADLDGDGDLDVLGAANLGDLAAWWENRTIHRAAVHPVEYVVEPNFDDARAVRIADLDGDAKPDLLGAAFKADRIDWWRNGGGDGTSWTARTIAAGFDGAIAAEAGDFDGDGDLDVVGAASGGHDVAWWENTAGSGLLWTKHLIDGTFLEATFVSPVDLDRDGDLDVLAAAATADDVAWWENADSRGTTWVKRLVAGNFNGAVAAAAGDFDGDGDLDLVGASRHTGMVWWENGDGAGVVWIPHGFFFAPGDVSAVDVADLDRDGDVDILAVSFFGEDVIWMENLFGDGSSWQANSIKEGLKGASSVQAVDMDADGDLDVLAAGSYERRVSWWENTAGDASLWAERLAPGRVWGAYDLRGADLDGDGDADLAAATVDPDQIRWWRNRGGQFLLTTQNSAPGAIREGTRDDVLRITATHRGRFSDDDIELAALELLLERQPGVALTDFEANALIESLHIYADGGTGVFSPVRSILVDSIDTLELDRGLLSIAFRDDDPNVRVAQWAGQRAYYVVPQLTREASALDMNQFRVTHLAAPSVVEPVSSVEDQVFDLPLAPEYTRTVSSSIVFAAPGEPETPVMVDEPLLTFGIRNTVHWFPVAFTTTYTAQCAEVGDFSTVLSSANVGAAQWSATFTSLTIGNLYWYRVRALNDIGPSGWSAPTSSTQEFPTFAWGPETWLPDTDITTQGILLPGPYGRSETSGAGFDVTGLYPRAKVYYSKWYMANADGKMFVIPHDGGGLADPVFEAVATLRSTAPEAQLCPGYRLLYANGAYSHLGGLTVTTPEPLGGAPVSAPYAGHDFEARVYWTTPVELTADSYATAGKAGYYRDGRDYSIMFDLVHNGTGDTGLLTLEAIAIRVFETPTANGPHIEWDGDEGGFDRWYAGYYGEESNDGTFEIVGQNAALRLSAADSLSRGYAFTYVNATPPHSLVDPVAADMPFADERLLRLTVDVRSEDVNRSPAFRVAALQIPREEGGNRPVLWMDVYGPSAYFVKAPGARQPGQIAPGAPTTEGSKVEMYVWTHGVVGHPALADDYVLPQIDVYSLDLYGLQQGTNSWRDDTGYLEFSRLSIETVDVP